MALRPFCSVRQQGQLISPALQLLFPSPGCHTHTLNLHVQEALLNGFSALIHSNPGHFTVKAHRTTPQICASVQLKMWFPRGLKLTTAYLNWLWIRIYTPTTLHFYLQTLLQIYVSTFMPSCIRTHRVTQCDHLAQSATTLKPSLQPSFQVIPPAPVHSLLVQEPGSWSIWTGTGRTDRKGYLF